MPPKSSLATLHDTPTGMCICVGKGMVLLFSPVLKIREGKTSMAL